MTAAVSVGYGGDVADRRTVIGATSHHDHATNACFSHEGKACES